MGNQSTGSRSGADDFCTSGRGSELHQQKQNYLHSMLGILSSVRMVELEPRSSHGVLIWVGCDALDSIFGVKTLTGRGVQDV